MFRTLNASTWPTDAMDQVVSNVASAYWLAFAKTGDPNGDNRPVWPAYAAKTDRLLDFTNDGPVARKTPDAAVLDAIGATRAEPAAKATAAPKPRARALRKLGNLRVLRSSQRAPSPRGEKVSAAAERASNGQQGAPRGRG